jgi:hypothetical protein
MSGRRFRSCEAALEQVQSLDRTRTGSRAWNRKNRDRKPGPGNLHPGAGTRHPL